MAAGITPKGSFGIEEEGLGPTQVVRIDGRRPVVSDGTGIVETGSVLVEKKKKKDAVTVASGNQTSIYSIPGRQRPCTIVK